MNGSRFQLIEAARAVCGDFKLRDEFSAGGVGAAIRTAKGNVYDREYREAGQRRAGLHSVPTPYGRHLQRASCCRPFYSAGAGRAPFLPAERRSPSGKLEAFDDVFGWFRYRSKEGVRRLCGFRSSL